MDPDQADFVKILLCNELCLQKKFSDPGEWIQDKSMKPDLLHDHLITVNWLTHTAFNKVPK